MTKSSFDLFKSFAGELDPETLQKKFLLSLLKLQNVHRGSIWIKNNNSYQCIEAAGKESRSIIGIEIDSNQPSIVGWVIENGKHTIADTKSDARHFKELEDNLAVKSSLILCFPLFLKNREVYGAVQIIDTTPEKTRVNLEESYLDYLQNLVDIGSVALSNAIVYSQQVKETESLKLTLRQIREGSSLVGHCQSFEHCLKLIKDYAASDLHVFITGESGTGKELVANEIYRAGPRKKKPFLVQNCSAIPETLLESELFGYRKGAFSGAMRNKKGLFEAANGGTVFLDEIGDMPINIQAAILRVLQNNEIKPVGSNKIIHVDVRIISATNRNVKKMIADSRFRQDLFYRLSILPLALPTLRDRREDIPLLVKYFLKRESLKSGTKEKKLSPDALQRLIRWKWPGNVRELENLIKYLSVVNDNDYITAEAIPGHFFEPSDRDPQKTTSPVSDEHVRSRDPRPPASPPSNAGNSTNNTTITPNTPGKLDFRGFSWEEIEERYYLFILRKNNWNVTSAAKAAGLNRSTFASRMRRLGINRTVSADLP